MRDAQFFQLRPYGVCVLQANWCQNDLAVLNRDVVVVSLARRLDDPAAFKQRMLAANAVPDVPDDADKD